MYETVKNVDKIDIESEGSWHHPKALARNKQLETHDWLILASGTWESGVEGLSQRQNAARGVQRQV